MNADNLTVMLVVPALLGVTVAVVVWLSGWLDRHGGGKHG
jgi:hypothetical protein